MFMARGIEILACYAAIALVAAGCSQNGDAIDPKGTVFDRVAPDEIVHLVGTEPFWAMRIVADKANYATPDQPEGYDFTVARFAGNNGLGFSGSLFEDPVTVTLTPGTCSDGMSDRRFPFVATVAMGEMTLRGCGYTDRQPYEGDPAP